MARQGRTTPALLPKADTVVAWVGPTDVSWHRITLPRAPASKLRAALVGMLEEQLLDDEQAVHLARGAAAIGWQPTWVAAVHKRWLTQHLEQLEKAGAFVERVVPALWPDDPATGHFFAASDAADGSSAQTWLAYSDADGVRCARMAGTWVRDQMTALGRDKARAGAQRPPSRHRPNAGSARRWRCAPTPTMRCRRCARCGTCASSTSPRGRAARALCATPGSACWSPAWRPARSGCWPWWFCM